MIDTVYISFCQDIQRNPVDRLVTTCNFAISSYKPRDIHILFASGGGHIGLGLSLFAFLKSLPVNIITHAAANVDSCAVNVFLAGRERYLTKTASFMIHPSTKSFKKDVSLSINELRLELITLKQDQDKIISHLSEHSNLSREDAEKYVTLGVSLNSSQALDAGIAHEIKEFEMKKDCPFIQV
ncbi:MAG: ATP-dependent Clp protease proteolytic subunit [Candidatus Electrothrix communis]|nr:ATP-dependent Clp protease proteolytic subunit [Desulfobulbus sp. US4]WLE97739.1 MAG: ATP-dependent Clp protease proteolytic subunit [Candidatus Electrothrix communis]